jgi:uncharacterized protein (TIGR03435 family)
MTRRAAALAIACGMMAAPAPAQDRAVRFEAASVKANTSGDGGMRIQTPPGRFVATNAPIWLLVVHAYDVQSFRIIGRTKVMDERFDVNATIATAPGQPFQDRVALRALLAERFDLVARRETRETEVFALVMARPDGAPGPRLKRSATDCSPEAAVARRAAAAAGTPIAGMCGAVWRNTQVQIGGQTMEQVANVLSPVDDRLIVDRTGLAGRWDAEFSYSDQVRPGAAGPDADLPDLPTALRESLGLKLERARAPVEVLVIERIATPAAD